MKKQNRDMKTSSTEKLLKVLEAKIDKLVEKRVQSIVPMLVEHEVNRLLKEERKVIPTPQPKPQQKVSLDKENITESLRSLVGEDISEFRSINYNTQTGIPGYQAQPMTTMEGRPVDTSNPAVQGILNIMNQGNLGDKFKRMDEKSKQRNGRI
jgi:hypothetical protein